MLLLLLLLLLLAHLACFAAALVSCEVVGGHLAVAARLELLQALQQRRRVKRIRRVKAAATSMFDQLLSLFERAC
jgi:hypothetical protein